MKEARFAAEVRRGFEGLGGFCCKIPDLPIFRGSRTRFNRPRPFDAFAVLRGRAIVMEFKVSGRSVPLSRLAPHQREALLAAERAGAKAYVVVGYKVGGRRRCVAVPVGEWLRAERSGRRSLPAEEARRIGTELRRADGGWDVSPLVGGAA